MTPLYNRLLHFPGINFRKNTISDPINRLWIDIFTGICLDNTILTKKG